MTALDDTQPIALRFCPECAAGKHVNCQGEAWDQEADEPTLCTCPGLEHPSRRLSCGCLLRPPSTLLEACSAHGQPLGAVSIESGAAE